VDDDARAALAAFCASEHRRLVGTLTLHCGDPHVASELAQDALARVCSDWKRVGRMDAPGAWLHRVAVNLASSHFRRRSAERRAVARFGSRQVEDPGGDPAGTLAVRRAVAALPLRQRTALVLRYYSDLSVQETAEAMGCAPGTVKSLTSQALAQLRASSGLVDHVRDLTALEEPSRA
jgi:RNA polymerase sigma-70 factor (sigma-E family)